MAGTPKTFIDETVYIPEAGQKPWYVEAQKIFNKSIDVLNSFVFKVSGVYLPFYPTSTTISLLGSATLTPTHTTMRVSGNGGPVVLGTTTAIADGSIEGQLLIVEGRSNTNTVEIRGNANTKGGDVILGLSDSITYKWSLVDSLWVEQGRSS